MMGKQVHKLPCGLETEWVFYHRGPSSSHVSIKRRWEKKKMSSKILNVPLIRYRLGWIHWSHHIEEVSGFSQAFNAVGVGQALHNAVCLAPGVLWRGRKWQVSPDFFWFSLDFCSTSNIHFNYFLIFCLSMGWGVTSFLSTQFLHISCQTALYCCKC